MEFFHKILNYLNKEQVSAKDVILISLITTFIAWLLKSLWKKIWGILISGVQKAKFIIKEFYRKQVKANLNVNEIIEIKKKSMQISLLNLMKRKPTKNIKLCGKIFINL